MTLHTVVTERGPTLTRVIPLFSFFNLVTMDLMDVGKRVFFFFFLTDQAADTYPTPTQKMEKKEKKNTDGIKPMHRAVPQSQSTLYQNTGVNLFFVKYFSLFQ